MKFQAVLSLVICGLLSLSASAETTIKILHLQKLPKVLEIWQQAAQEYEKAHPGVKIEFDYLENEAFKAKLPTLLQSKDRPTLFHSWGGGVMIEQINAGVVQDITAAIADGGFKDTFYPAGVQNFTYQGKTYGLPGDIAPIVFWYNKELCAKAGVDPTKIKTWDDFIDAVKKCQAAGITPLAVGGKDEWPLHFYPAFLLMRILGKDGMQAVIEGKNGGLGGKGHANDIFASVDGWLVAKDAPKETVDWMKVWLSNETQDKIAEEGLFIPVVKGTDESIKEPFYKAIAQEVGNTQWIQIAMDQLLGPDTGRVFNDACTDIAAGKLTADKAAKAIEDSWEQNNK